MSPTRWCIENNRTFALIILAIAFLGIGTYQSISKLEDPDFTVRIAVISTVFPGASPQKVEELVTDKLEEKIREIAELDYVESRSMSGVSLIYVHVQERFMDMKPIWDRLRNKVDDVRPSLPEGVSGPYVNDEFGDVFGIVAAITGDGYSYRELKDVADDVRDELLRVKDVAKVERHGVQDERIFVNFSNARLAELGVSPAFIMQTLRQQNAIAPGGNALVGTERVVVEPTGEFKSLEQLAGTSISLPGKAQNIQLKDIATIERTFVDPPSELTRFNGKPCLMLAVSMAKGGNIVEMGKRLDATLKDIQARMPVGIDFNYVSYQPRFVDQAIGDFMVNLYEAFGFVVVVMLVFAGLRTALVAGLLVPMAIFMSIALMPFFDVVMQRVSIASLIIALGMLVDNGVVISENILVRLGRGEDRMKAVTEAATNLRMPLLAASLTTIFAFMPIATAKSETGEYCLSLFIVITLTLLSSWVLSLTFVPYLCFYVLKVKPTTQEFKGFFYSLYRGFLKLCLRHRLVFVVLVVGLTAYSMYAFRYIPKIFFPPNDREMVVIDFWQPYGTDIGVTVERVGQLEHFLMDQPGVVSVGTFAGYGGPRWYLAMNIEQTHPNYAFLVVNTESLADAHALLQSTRNFVAGHLPDTRADVKMLEMGPPVGAPIQIRLSGKDMDKLFALRDKIEDVLDKTSGVTDIWDDWGEWTKKLVVDVDQERAKRAGISSQDIAMSLNTQISGMPITQFREGDTLIPVVFRSEKQEREGLDRLDDLNVTSYQSGKSLPLSQVAETRMTWQPGNIRRRDQTRTLTVKATVSGRFASEIMEEIRPKIEALHHSSQWPAGYGIHFGGEDEEAQKSQASIMAGMPLAMAFILVTLMSQFNSVRRTLIILLTIPPMYIGITWGMMLSDSPFGFMAMLGMISLMGIIINNAIILIDAIERERERGREPYEALVLAAQKRLRPILMTACTTVIGLIPLSLQGGEMWRPMANVIIFGLAFATVLTLGLCPVLYSLFFNVREKPEG
ncbi:MAG: efflux RND transporter permease subunit [Desulfovibrio sp.]|uniref:efflux RND transporter permease subunit n=1 Tax=Desulfovibrio sp. 7SRBS1 TaxID=3378064 RepID=UPI003B404FB4